MFTEYMDIVQGMFTPSRRSHGTLNGDEGPEDLGKSSFIHTKPGG
jgi:hypothetical protein